MTTSSVKFAVWNFSHCSPFASRTPNTPQAITSWKVLHMDRRFTDTRRCRACAPKASADYKLTSKSDLACREIDKDIRTLFEPRIGDLELSGLYLEEGRINGAWELTSAVVLFLILLAVVSWKIHTGNWNTAFALGNYLVGMSVAYLTFSRLWGDYWHDALKTIRVRRYSYAPFRMFWLGSDFSHLCVLPYASPFRWGHSSLMGNWVWNDFPHPSK